MTTRLWTTRSHPADGRAALVIQATPAVAGWEILREAYDALLNADERAMLTPTLPEGWESSKPEM